MNITQDIKTVRSLRKKEILLEQEITEKQMDLAAIRKMIAILDKEIDDQRWKTRKVGRPKTKKGIV